MVVCSNQSAFQALPSLVSQKEKSRIAYLDGWRGFAVLAVIIQHASQTVVAIDSTILHNLGRIGVYIFFLISSFVITRQCLDEIEQTGSLDQRRFFLRRALRIFPPLLLYLFVVVAISDFNPSIVEQAIRAATFTCNTSIFQPDCIWIFGHTWSLAFEEQAYLLFPLLFVRRFSIWFLLALGLVSLPFFMPVHFIGRFGYVSILLLFVIGFLYARYQDRAQRWLNQIPVWLVLCAPVGCLAWTALEDGIVRDVSGLLLPLCAFLMVFRLPQRIGWLKNLLESRPLVQIGVWSYSLYLWQQLFLAPDGASGVGGLVYALFLVFLISILSYYSYEKWFRDLSRQYGTPPGKTIAAGSKLGTGAKL